MGRVARARADLRRARRGLRKLEEDQGDLLEDLTDSLADLDVETVAAVGSGLDRLARQIEFERSRVARLDEELEERIEERRAKRREAWEDVRRSLERFGPSVLDVLADVFLVASSPREERIGVAAQALLDHVQIEIDPGDVTLLAERIVDALED